MQGTRIAMLGLGNMGGSMSKNLLKAGARLAVYDVNAAAVADAGAAGARVATSAADAAADAEVVVSMLPNAAIVRSTYLDADAGVLASVPSGALLIDCSTIDPASARDVATAASAAGSDFVDGPVSGGVTGAAAGTLTFMVGAADDSSVFARAKPVLSAMGKNIVPCGVIGAGQVAKLANNLVLACSMIGVSEAFAFADAYGMDKRTLHSILATSTARCWSVDSYSPVPGTMEGVPSSRNYEGGFGSALMAKDLGLVNAAAHAAGVPVPLAGEALQVYNLLCRLGHGQRDFGVIYELLSKKQQ